MSVTMQQIAKIAGVSRGTVDRVLNERPGVNPDTYKKVKEIAERLNYRPNLAARALKFSHRSCKIGVLMMDHNEFTDQIRSGMEKTMENYSEIDVELSFAYCPSNSAAVIKAIDDLIASGISCLAIRSFDDMQICDKINEVSKNGTPVLTFNTDIQNINRLCYIGENSIATGRVAAELMAIALREHGNVLVATSSSIAACKTRSRNFVNLLTYRYPDINIVDQIELDAGEDAIAQFMSYLNCKNIDGIYITETKHINRIMQFLCDHPLNSRFSVITHDILPSVVEQIFDDNFVKFLIGQEPEKQGALCIKILVDYIYYGIIPPKEIYTNIDIRVKDTAATSSSGVFTQSSTFSSIY